MNFISSFFMDVLQLIYGIVGNYGWSVVLFTLLVRFVLLPLDIKSKKGMRAMNKVQPKIQALQKKYANDKEKLNMKMQELYKKEKINPMAGCLPMLIQLPVLWFMFSAMRYLANEHTIEMILNLRDGEEVVLQSWLWIKNVFQPDSFSASILPKVGSQLMEIGAVKGTTWLTAENIEAARVFLASEQYASIAASYGATAENFMTIPINLLLFQFHLNIPRSFYALTHYANGLFILPVLAGVSQFLTSKLMNVGSGQQPQQNAQTENNAMNSGFMKWFFPIFSIWICASSNSAFSIYWMAANVIQILQTILVNIYFEHKDKQEAQKAMEAP